MAKERAKQKVNQQHAAVAAAAQKQRQVQQRALVDTPEQKILKNALTQSQTSSPYGSNLTVNNSGIDVVSRSQRMRELLTVSQWLIHYFRSKSFIKEEPEDAASDLEDADGVDPTQFLAQEDDGAADEDGPPILTSLGLTHINHVSPFQSLGNAIDEPCVDFVSRPVRSDSLPRNFFMATESLLFQLIAFGAVISPSLYQLDGIL